MKNVTKKTIAASLLAATVISGCAISSQETPTNENTQKEKVVELIHSIENGNHKAVGYINPNKYIQHNLAVKDGISGFGEVMALLPKGSAKAKVIRAFSDGEFVFTHTKYDFFGPKAGFDIFRFEEGKIVEHWDNLQSIVEKTASGRSQFDGPVEITDIEKTQENKVLVKNFISDVLFGKNPDNISQYISTETYNQHNPMVKDGLKGLGEALESLAKSGMPMVYEKSHKILGEGNFVLATSEGKFLNKHVSFYDLFRVENGKIVEHWDTIEEIPEKTKWQNNNGKF